MRRVSTRFVTPKSSACSPPSKKTLPLSAAGEPGYFIRMKLKRSTLYVKQPLSPFRVSVSLDPVVPYAWQFADEDVWMPASQGPGLNCLGLIRRDSTLLFEVSPHNFTAEFIVERLERLSLGITEETVIVLDNAKIHTAKAI